jgi:hypothetical protein
MVRKRLEETKQELEQKIKNYYGRNGQMYTGDRSFVELQNDLHQIKRQIYNL